jgi:hypothetical protein
MSIVTMREACFYGVPFFGAAYYAIKELNDLPTDDINRTKALNERITHTTWVTCSHGLYLVISLIVMIYAGTHKNAWLFVVSGLVFVSSANACNAARNYRRDSQTKLPQIRLLGNGD